jgi:hypothetical protein
LDHPNVYHCCIRWYSAAISLPTLRCQAIRTTVSDNTIYFSDPRSFNDPWDCKPWFIVDSLDDPGELERYVQWYIDISRRHHTGISEAQIQVTAARYRADPALFRAKIKEFSQTMAADHRRRVPRVLS